jgi:uncharacterized protein YkwD
MTLKDFINWLISIFKPKPTPTPTPIPTPPSDQLGALLTLHNEHRAKLNISELTLNDQLTKAAQKHSNWMFQNNTMNHNEGAKGVGDRIREEGYVWRMCGENIAEGYPNAQAVFQGWLNSSGHRHNIENSGYKNVGMGVAGKFWTVDFGARLGILPVFVPGGIRASLEDSRT